MIGLSAEYTQPASPFYTTRPHGLMSTLWMNSLGIYCGIGAIGVIPLGIQVRMEYFDRMGKHNQRSSNAKRQTPSACD